MRLVIEQLKVCSSFGAYPLFPPGFSGQFFSRKKCVNFLLIGITAIRKAWVVMSGKVVGSKAKEKISSIPAVKLTSRHLLISLVRFGHIPKPAVSMQDMEESEIREYLKSHNVYLKR